MNGPELQTVIFFCLQSHRVDGLSPTSLHAASGGLCWLGGFLERVYDQFGRDSHRSRRRRSAGTRSIGRRPATSLVLAARRHLRGNFVLPNKGAIAGYITIRSAAPDASLPPAGVRISPADAAQLPKIRSANSPSALQTAPAAQPLAAAAARVPGQPERLRRHHRARRRRLDAQTPLAQVPHDLVLDRVYIHGDPVAGQKRGIALNSGRRRSPTRTSSDFKAVGQDSQAISGWNGPGPFDREQLPRGGGRKLAVRRRRSGDPEPGAARHHFRRNYVGQAARLARSRRWPVKNLFELKNARRVTRRGNMFEDNWRRRRSGTRCCSRRATRTAGAWAGRGRHAPRQHHSPTPAARSSHHRPRHDVPERPRTSDQDWPTTSCTTSTPPRGGKGTGAFRLVLGNGTVEMWPSSTIPSARPATS